MKKPEIVSPEAWQQAREELLKAEKELTRAEDSLAARRRRLPMVQLSGDYDFETPEGPASLTDLFGQNDQLAVYQFMDNGPDHFCPGCTHFTTNVPSTGVAELAGKGISWRTVSNMPLVQMTGYWQRMGWTTPYASSHGTSWSDDTGAGGMFQLSVFLRAGAEVYQTYATSQRGVDRLVFANNVQDLSPYGRQEDWEDSPAGWPQRPTYG